VATFNGTVGNDTITGGTDNDVINGLQGNDSLLGGGGSDTINGGSGNDYVSGNEGADWVEGSIGNDEVRGGAGQDSIAFHEFGTSNADLLSDFDAGWDNIQLDAAAFTNVGAVGRFASGDVRFYSAPGASAGHDADDRIIYNSTTGQLYYDSDGSGANPAQLIATIANHSALAATDISVFGSAPSTQAINGTAGNDSLTGGPGNDTINGLAGNDTLDGSRGNDSLTGGVGNDSFIYAAVPGSDADRIADFSSGSDSIRLDANWFSNGLGGNGDFAADDVRFYAAPGATFAHDFNDRIVYNTTTGDLYYSNHQVSQLLFTLQGAPTITASDISVINALNTGIQISGTNGNDSIDGTPGGDGVNGNGGDDTINGGDGGDAIGGDAGNDWVAGGNGDDFIDGSSGNDTLVGGAGADTFNFGYWPSAVDADQIADFTSATDTIRLQAGVMAALGAEGRMSAGDPRFSAAPDNSNATVIHYNTSTGQLWYTADPGHGTSQLIATLNGARGLSSTDILVFGNGDRTIVGTSGNDNLGGGDGNDLISGLGGNDTLNGGGAGHDTLDGGTGDDIVVGGPGSDSMIGGDGNDTLNGLNRPATGPTSGYNDADVDTMDGGAGNDTYYVDNPADVLIDAGGVDTVISQNVNWTLGTGFENLLVFSDDQGGGGTGNELGNVINGANAFNGTLQGLGGDDSIIGGGKSTLFGGEGNDTLAGNDLDTMDGGNGDDLFIAHNNDQMTGGAGSDAFRLGTIVTSSDILDFSSGVDRIELDARLMTELGASGRFVADDPRFFVGTAAHDADDRIILNGSQLFYDPDGNGAQGASQIASTFGHSVAATDLWVVNGSTPSPTPSPTPTPTPTPIPAGSIVGTAGNDNLQGTTGNDSMFGLGGNDTIYANAGNDWVQGGAGNDSVSGGGGQDIYAFAEYGAQNADVVTSFDTGWDAIRLDAAGFSNIGAAGRFSGGDVRFFSGAGATSAHDADDRIVYNTSTGQLFYDADGAGGASADLIATFQAAPGMVASDITVFGTPSPSPTPTPTPSGSTINGTENGDMIGGTDGNDTINALGGDDLVYGLAGNDQISGGSGDDVLIGDQGDDSMVGGLGNDVFALFSREDFAGVSENQGNDTIDGGDGIDRVSLSEDGESSTHGATIDLAAGTYSITDNSGTAHGVMLNIEQVGGSWVSDRIMGSAAANFFDGSGGDDSLFGAAGNDTIIGNDGADVLSGGLGNDTLTGDGNLHGADTFVFDAAPGVANADVITDFSDADGDHIQLDGNAMVAIGPSGNFTAGDVRFYAAAGANGGHDADDRLVYDTSTGQLFYDADGNGASVAQLIATLPGAPALAASDLTVVNGSSPTPTPTPGTSLNGTSGNDTLVGTTGNDTIFGNSGNDWIEGREGHDTLSGGSGLDSYVFREFGAANADTLNNFDGNNWDSLRFDNAAFTALGPDGQFSAGDARFFAAAGATGGHDADDRIVYNTSSGQLYYDADGAGGADAQLVATIQGAAPVAAPDIWVI
jgi:Ca2+-binding RTX toxin-like protein